MPLRIILLENQPDTVAALDAAEEWCNSQGDWLPTVKQWYPRLNEDGRTLGATMLGALAPYVLGKANGRHLVASGSWENPTTAARLGIGRVRMLRRAAMAHGHMLIGMREDPKDIPGILDSYQRAINANGWTPNAIDAPGSGAWKPGQSVLLVGDKPNSAMHGTLKHRLPFFSMHGGGSSLWLALYLEDNGIDEESLYWINSADHMAAPTDAAFVHELRPKGIVALGSAASAWCKANNFIHSTVHHPSYVMRQPGGVTKYNLASTIRRYLNAGA